MLDRISYGALAIALLLAMAVVDSLAAEFAPRQWGMLGDLLAAGSLIPVCCAIVSILASRELLRLLAGQQVFASPWYTTITCVLLVVAPWVCAAGWFGASPSIREMAYVQVALIGLAFVGAGFVQLRHPDLTTTVSRISASWLVIGYCGVLPSFLTLMRCDVNVPGPEGPWVVLVVILVCKSSDIGAYFAGTLLGRHKLLPRVSPGKTIEGFAGGIFASCAVSLLIFYFHFAVMPGEGSDAGDSWLTDVVHQAYRITAPYRNLTQMQAIVFGALMSIVGQFGDLVESAIKRSCHAKDSGNILPGFGGILDMVDSPFAVAPVAWFLLTQVWAAV